MGNHNLDPAPTPAAPTPGTGETLAPHLEEGFQDFKISVPFSQENSSSGFPVLPVHVVLLRRAVQRLLCIKDMNLSCGYCHQTSEMGEDESHHNSTRASGQLTFLSPFHSELWIYVVKGATKKCFNVSYLAQRITMCLSIIWVVAQIWLTKCIMYQSALRHLPGRNRGSFHGEGAWGSKVWDFTVTGRFIPWGMTKDKSIKVLEHGKAPCSLEMQEEGGQWFCPIDKAMSRIAPRIRTIFPIFPHFSLFPNIKVNLSSAI